MAELSQSRPLKNQRAVHYDLIKKSFKKKKCAFNAKSLIKNVVIQNVM